MVNSRVRRGIIRKVETGEYLFDYTADSMKELVAALSTKLQTLPSYYHIPAYALVRWETGTNKTIQKGKSFIWIGEPDETPEFAPIQRGAQVSVTTKVTMDDGDTDSVFPDEIIQSFKNQRIQVETKTQFTPSSHLTKWLSDLPERQRLRIVMTLDLDSPDDEPKVATRRVTMCDASTQTDE